MRTSLERAARGSSAHLGATIGNTPLVRLAPTFAPEFRGECLLKLEGFNPGGSVKDRIAWSMVKQAEADGQLRPGGVIVEGTSGNTGIGLALVAAARGYDCVIVVPDRLSQEKLSLLRAYGARVELTPSGVAADDAEHFTQVARRLARELPGGWLADQFENPANPQAHYETTGPEIWEQTGGKIDSFVAGCGTGGTLCGVARFLKGRHPEVQIIGVDPVGSVLEGTWREGRPGKKQANLVEGVGQDFVPATWDPSLIDEYRVISDEEAIECARRLVRETGILVGASGGMALAAALRAGRRGPADQRIVVLMPDRGERYTSKYFDKTWLADHGLAAEPEARHPRLSDWLPPEACPVLHPDDNLARARELLLEADRHTLPVVERESGKVLGVLDELKWMREELDGAKMAAASVADLLRPAPPILSEETPWERVTAALTQSECVLVRKADGWALFHRRDLLRRFRRP